MEEIDIIERGGNYGWNVKEGPACFGSDRCAAANLVEPVAAYRTQGAASVVGGFVYRGSALPAIRGKYVYSDFVHGSLWAIGEGDAAPTLLSDSAGREISAYAETPDGELLAVRYGGGIYRLVAPPASDAPPLPARLSETHCVDMAAPQQAPAGLIGYDVGFVTLPGLGAVGAYSLDSTITPPVFFNLPGARYTFAWQGQ